MALIPTSERLHDFTNIVAELNTFLTGVTGWVIDKYVVDSELYVHTTAGDATVAYYSMELVAIDAYSQKLVIYANTGFNTGSAVDAQPGVMTNASGSLSYAVHHGTSLGMREGWMVANDNFFLVSCVIPGIEKAFSFDHIYCGNIDKDFAFTGGQFITGNQVHEASTPLSTMFYNGGTPTWYTEDGGLFADAGGLALERNHITYAASGAFGYSHHNSIIHLTPMAIFVAHDGGFAPVGVAHKVWECGNSNDHLVPYGHIRIGGIIYFTIPKDLQGSDHIVVEVGTY